MVLLPPTLQTAESILSSLPSSEPHYLLFWASNDERGRPWCRDCENAKEPVTRNILDRQSTLIYVGDRATWNDPKNLFRQPPFNVERVPTVVRVDPLPHADQARTESVGVNAHDRVPCDYFVRVWAQLTGERQVAKAPRLVEGEILDEARLRSFVGKA